MYSAECFAWVREKYSKASTLVNVAESGQAPEITANTSVIDAACRNYWGNIWKTPDAGYPEIENLFTNACPEIDAEEPPDITADDITQISKE